MTWQLQYHRIFTGELVRLTGYREEDPEMMVKWQEDAEYLRSVDTDFALPGSIESVKGGPSGRGANNVEMRIRTLEDDRLIGFAAIHSIEWNNQSGILAVGIGEAEYRGRGYGTDAVKVLLRYAFHELNLNRVGLTVIEYNAKGVRVYEKAGFQVEGRAREAVLREGRSFDLISMGILRREWEALNRP